MSMTLAGLSVEEARGQRERGLCESVIWRGPNAVTTCRLRAGWIVPVDGEALGDLRLCTSHARAFTSARPMSEVR